MKELLKSYRETLYGLHKVKIGADTERNRLKEIHEKEPTEESESQLAQAQEYCDKINSFVSNVLYVVTWLNKGYPPNPRRAIHRRSREQNEVLMEPLKMQSYANPAACGSPTTITDGERFMLDEAMHNLTDREKDCYMLKYGQCYSERQIATMLRVDQKTVHEFIKKAQKKVDESLRNNIFLQNT